MNLEHLEAGSVRALFDRENGFLRHIRIGRTEVLRGIYAAVRDHNWGTIEPEIENLDIRKSPGEVTVGFTARHRLEPVDFTWQGRIRIESTGRIHYTFDGKALSGFRRNRIGFCVLHSPECGGLPAEIETVDGELKQTRFPKAISPHQPMMDLRSIRHHPEPGLEVTVRMEGDVFEMEDQRNWTDASFKTYCTPLGLPFPVEVVAGTTVRQAISITATPAVSSGRAEVGDEALVRIKPDDSATVTRLPAIGLATDRSSPIALSTRAIERLRELKPAHLRVDLRLAVEDWISSYEGAQDQARALECGLEIAVHLGADVGAELERAREFFSTRLPVVPIPRLIVFSGGSKVTRADDLGQVRDILGLFLPDTEIGGGTDAYFTEINRERPPLDGLDFVSFSLNPQVHAFDDLSLTETLCMQGNVVHDAAEFTGKSVIVSPVSLRPRFNPNATGPEPEPTPGELPASVDPRQRLPFSGPWTLGSIKHLSEAGAASITFFETVGWKGVLEGESGSPLPNLFPSQPFELFPPYRVLRAMAGWQGAGVTPLRSVDPLRADALLLRKDGAFLALLANHTAIPLDVLVDWPGDLDMDTARLSIVSPALPERRATRLSAKPSRPIHLPPESVLALTHDHG